VSLKDFGANDFNSFDEKPAPHKCPSPSATLCHSLPRSSRGLLEFPNDRFESHATGKLLWFCCFFGTNHSFFWARKGFPCRGSFLFELLFKIAARSNSAGPSRSPLPTSAAQHRRYHHKRLSLGRDKPARMFTKTGQRTAKSRKMSERGEDRVLGEHAYVTTPSIGPKM